ncbi:DUF6626 family protein [Agrobacterium pusense]|uniref:DUF6626 family protein n=1 Tax=Agrobacterium pusense TaxID=648995 RepID=UPI0035A64470
MNNDIEFLETVCERMQQTGLVQSKADFSTRMLGKGPSYLTSMSARTRNVPEDVIVFLRQQLEADIVVGQTTIAVFQEKLSEEEHTQECRYQLLNEVTANRKCRRSEYQNGDANDNEKKCGEKKREILRKFLTIFRFSLRAFPKLYVHRDAKH